LTSIASGPARAAPAPVGFQLPRELSGTWRILTGNRTLPGVFQNPTDVAVDAQGNVYVDDTQNFRIQKLSPTGQVLSVIGDMGYLNGQFRFSQGLALDRSGNIYVADTENSRIEKISPRGYPIAVWDQPGCHPGELRSPEGVALDPAGNIYVAVGNGAATGGNWDHSDSVLRLSPTLQLEDGFAPTQWAQENAGDTDLGSTGPILLPGGLNFADGKTGLGYLLHADALGGVGGQAQVKSICRSFGGAALLNSQLFVPCTDGLRQVMVGPGATMTLGWQAASQITGSPIVGGNTVYSLNPACGILYALDVATGNTRAMLSIGATSRFATPTLSGNLVFVGTLSGVVAVTLS